MGRLFGSKEVAFHSVEDLKEYHTPTRENTKGERVSPVSHYDYSNAVVRTVDDRRALGVSDVEVGVAGIKKGQPSPGEQKVQFPTQSVVCVLTPVESEDGNAQLVVGARNGLEPTTANALFFGVRIHDPAVTLFTHTVHDFRFRHSKNAHKSLEDKLMHALKSPEEYRESVLSTYHDISNGELDDARQASDIMLRSVRDGAIPKTDLIGSQKESGLADIYESKSHRDTYDDNSWGLFLAGALMIQSHQDTNPVKAMERGMIWTQIFREQVAGEDMS